MAVELGGRAGLTVPAEMTSPRSSKGVQLLVRGALVVLALVVALVVWQAVVDIFNISKLILPPPTDVAKSLYESRSVYLSQLRFTLVSAAFGFLIGVGSGVIVAVVVTQVKLFNQTLYPLIVGLNSMPIIGLAPVFIVWFGFGTECHALFAAVIVFFPVFLNMVHGLDGVSGDSVLLLRSYRANWLQTLVKLRLPAALPFLFAGIDFGAIVAVLGVIVAEFLGASQGMGFLLVEDSNNLAISGVFAVMVIMAVIGLALHLCILLIRNRVLHWAIDNDA